MCVRQQHRIHRPSSTVCHRREFLQQRHLLRYARRCFHQQQLTTRPRHNAEACRKQRATSFARRDTTRPLATEVRQAAILCGAEHKQFEIWLGCRCEHSCSAASKQEPEQTQ